MNELGRDIRTGRFWRRFGLYAFAFLGASTVVIELLDVLLPDIFTEIGSAVAVVIAIGAIVYGAHNAWPRPIEQSYDSPRTKIRIIKGDLFNKDDAHLVIGMCDTFDTAVPHIIARRSVQGQFLDKVFHDDVQALDDQLADALSGVDSIEEVDKPGKQHRYPIGTVATISTHSRRYFCVAYTRMNERNETRGSVDSIWRSLDCVWQASCAHGNGEPIAIPVIGGGQARISQVIPAQDSIRFIVLSFVLSSQKEKICDELRVVVRPEDYEKLDRQELQSFLRSLKPS